jgi:hypothetical protein
MKSIIVLAAAFALLPALAQAQTVVPPPQCVKGTLASYIALGAEGCVFDNAVYSNFSYSTPVVSGSTSTTSITAAEILVTPFLLPTATMFPGLNFSPAPASATASWSVGPDKTAEFVVGYLVTPVEAVCACPAEPVGGTTCVCPPIAVTSAPLTLDLGASKILGVIGSVTVQENVTEFLPPVGTTGGSTPVPTTVATLNVYDTCDEVCRILQTDTVTISPVVPLQTNIIVTLGGGTGGVSLNGFASDLAIGPQPE